MNGCRMALPKAGGSGLQHFMNGCRRALTKAGGSGWQYFMNGCRMVLSKAGGCGGCPHQKTPAVAAGRG